MKITRLLLACGLAALAAQGQAQMVTGAKIPGFDETMGTSSAAPADYTATCIESSAPGNILWPGEQAEVTIQIVNNTAAPLKATGQLDIVRYATRGRPGDIWKPDMYRLAVEAGDPVHLDVAPHGWTNLKLRPTLPEIKGAYALVLDLGPQGRRFVTSLVRTFRAERKPEQYPQLCMDIEDPDVLTRLGVAPNRIGIPYRPTTDPDFERWYTEATARLREYSKAHLSVTVEIGGGNTQADQPLGRPRPHLDDNGFMKDTKFDLAWLPSYDADFKLFVKRLVSEFGWPRGPVNSIKLFNEPWEGLSISGWGADMIRYREIFTAMAEATEEARRDARVEVLIGGCDSEDNTFDKLFGDGKDTFLPWLDFVSVHYAGMFPPSTIKAWLDRKSPRGRVRIWDTESWVANCDDRVAAVVATNLSTGHDRAVGVYGGNVVSAEHPNVFDASGKSQRGYTLTAWPVAAAVGAVTHFIGERKFKELLFKDGLPWVMVFDGQVGPDGKAAVEDGTVVVVGDLGEEFGPDNVLFRTARGMKEVQRKEELRHKLAALPDDDGQRGGLEGELRESMILSDASMTLIEGGDHFGLYDFYGNPVPAKDGRIVVPLDGRGFFLRGNGKPGSFAALLQAIRQSRIEGIEPLAKTCHDLLAPIGQKPDLRLTLQNVLNRPVSGRLDVTLGALKLDPASQNLSFAAHEKKEVVIRVTEGTETANNTYPLRMVFDAGNDCRSVHEEDLHVNVIAGRTITVDGKLDDWKGVMPQTVTGDGTGGPTLTETAWLPFEKFDVAVKKGFATGYLAHDDRYFYFAARIADDTPDEGTLRFETRDDDEFFYPAISYVKRVDNPRIARFLQNEPVETTPLAWPAEVPRFTYRKRPILPSGSAPNFDNVQIAFNVLPPEAKPKYPCPPGTMPGYIGYSDTDYEYALNQVAPKYGGGVEIWRLAAPGMPRKHFYPRQPASPKDGPVKEGKLAVVRDGNTRIVECRLPWSEIPDVKKCLDAGQTIKFSFRVNDNGNAAGLELSRKRSVAKRNPSFSCGWVEHWANEIEFAWEK